MDRNFQFSIFNFQKRAGFTIFEVMMAIALAAIVVTIVLVSFSKMNEKKALDASTTLAVSVLDEARTLTLTGVGGIQYGVHLEAGKTALFRGSTYTQGNLENVESELHPLTAIRNITLIGGGNDVVFEKLTGRTTNTGTFEVFLISSPTQYRIISINSNGIVEEN